MAMELSPIDEVINQISRINNKSGDKANFTKSMEQMIEENDNTEIDTNDLSKNIKFDR